MGHCDQCDNHYEDLALAQIAPTLIRLAAEYDVRLTGELRLLRAHRLPGTWSALEYSCHHRDTLRVQLERIRQALVEDCPEFVPMGREERVVAKHYNDQDPTTVASELVSAANALAADLVRPEPGQWNEPASTPGRQGLNGPSPGWDATRSTRPSTTSVTSIEWSQAASDRT
jgi:hypothetical protein